MKGADSQFSHLHRGQEKIEAKLDDVQDDITSALAALDTESIKLLDHEQRIRRLEKSEA
jgi:peptidoglycan hydrolase CwlO-like protein